MGSESEHVQFHTSVLCAGDVKFFFAKEKTSVGQGYVLTMRRSTADTAKVKTEKCESYHQYENEECTYSNFKVKLVAICRYLIKCNILTNLKE